MRCFEAPAAGSDLHVPRRRPESQKPSRYLEIVLVGGVINNSRRRLRLGPAGSGPVCTARAGASLCGGQRWFGGPGPTQFKIHFKLPVNLSFSIHMVQCIREALEVIQDNIHSKRL